MSEASQARSFGVSATAAAQISKILESESGGKMLRVSVSGGGCSGFQYGFDLVKDIQEDDIVVERDGVKVLVDSISIEYMDGSILDYVDDLIGASFQVKNPNAMAECGCGTSFSI